MRVFLLAWRRDHRPQEPYFDNGCFQLGNLVLRFDVLVQQIPYMGFGSRHGTTARTSISTSRTIPMMRRIHLLLFRQGKRRIQQDLRIVPVGIWHRSRLRISCRCRPFCTSSSHVNTIPQPRLPKRRHQSVVSFLYHFSRASRLLPYKLEELDLMALGLPNGRREGLDASEIGRNERSIRNIVFRCSLVDQVGVGVEIAQYIHEPWHVGVSVRCSEPGLTAVRCGSTLNCFG